MTVPGHPQSQVIVMTDEQSRRLHSQLRALRTAMTGTC